MTRRAARRVGVAIATCSLILFARYRVTWCGRFAVPFGLEFARRLARATEGRTLTGLPLASGTSLSTPWLPIWDLKLGITGDANLHHFVTYQAIGFR